MKMTLFGEISNKQELLDSMASLIVMAQLQDVALKNLLSIYKNKTDRHKKISVVNPLGNDLFMSLGNFFDNLDSMSTVPLTKGIDIARATSYRNACKEFFRIVQAYCDRTGQKPKLILQPWYQFFRMVTNCVSHSHKFEFISYDKTQLPVSFNGVTISIQDDDTIKPINVSTVMKLCGEMGDFVEKNLQ